MRPHRKNMCLLVDKLTSIGNISFISLKFFFIWKLEETLRLHTALFPTPMPYKHWDIKDFLILVQKGIEDFKLFPSILATPQTGSLKRWRALVITNKCWLSIHRGSRTSLVCWNLRLIPKAMFYGRENFCIHDKEQTRKDWDIKHKQIANFCTIKAWVFWPFIYHHFPNGTQNVQ